MKAHVEGLIELASPPLSDDTPRLPSELHGADAAVATDLLGVLWRRNGFYAFESALHVRPLCEDSSIIGIAQWNAPHLWRSTYAGLAEGLLFFGEDIFGAQFGIGSDGIYRFDPETGDRLRAAASLDEWASLILRESREQTGWPLAHEWQRIHGALTTETRLVPKVPFVLGGDFTIENLHPVASVKAMRFYGEVAVQLHDVADGAKVRLRVTD